MSWDESFTLCPSNVGAFRSYSGRKRSTRPDDDISEENGGDKASNILAHKKTKVDKAAKHKRAGRSSPLLLQCVNAYPKHPACLIPGTIMQDLILFRPTPKTIRALPFEPLVHQRGLPKGGTISPFLVAEHTSVGQPTAPATCQDGPPPVVEIRIPTPPQSVTRTTSVQHSGIDTETESADWKNLYFCSQRELHLTKEHSAQLDEENRFLKRKMIEMQRHLFDHYRSRQIPNSHTACWSVPRNDRQTAVTPAEKEIVITASTSTSSGDEATRPELRRFPSPSNPGYPQQDDEQHH